MKRRALDLFCSAGGATRGLQLAGFHVTGVDIRPQPRYCGDEFRQASALEFPLEGFDFIWASPPCQKFTALRHMPTSRRDHPNLIPQTRARLEKSGIPYAIENVEGAPLGDSGYLIRLCGTSFGLATKDWRAELRRHRLFETTRHSDADLASPSRHSPTDTDPSLPADPTSLPFPGVSHAS